MQECIQMPIANTLQPIADQGGMAARYTAYNSVPAAHILTSNLQFCVHEWGWNLPWWKLFSGNARTWGYA